MKTIMNMALLSSLAFGCVGQDESSPGPFIDPDEHLRQAKANRALYGGTWPDVPEPGEKRWHPETNLRDYPKLPTTDAERVAIAERAASAARAAPTVEVMQIETDGNRITVRIYDPAPGVTPEALADELRASGKQGVQLVTHAAEEVNNLGPNSCTYGYAKTWNCPVAYWANNGRSNPWVIFNDHSSAQWPVSSVVPKWNQVVGIDSGYRWNDCPLSTGAWCVDVVSGNYGYTGWEGLTHMSMELGGNGGRFLSGAWVQLNERHTPMGWTRNNTATHELGHILGLGHNSFVGDVMWGASMREDIGGENRTLLESLYSIGRD
jgi:hypothetical protein